MGLVLIKSVIIVCSNGLAGCGNHIRIIKAAKQNFTLVPTVTAVSAAKVGNSPFLCHCNPCPKPFYSRRTSSPTDFPSSVKIVCMLCEEEEEIGRL